MINPFLNFVSLVGFLVAAATSVGLTWKRKAKWEPAITDIPDITPKVAGLFNALFLAAIWYDNGKSFGIPSLQTLTICSAAVLLLGMIIYVFLLTVYTFEKEVADGHQRTRKQKIIGGLWQTARARVETAKGVDLQTTLARAANKLDLVWPRSARALSQILFQLGYVMLVCGGTVALSAAALLLLRG